MTSSWLTGARVEITRGGARWVREQRIGEGYLGNFDPRLHFGIPGDAPIDVSVRWPSGLVTEHFGVPIDGEIVLTEPPP